jgi:hypothetical protein
VLGVIAVMGAHKDFTIENQPVDKAVVIVQRGRVSQSIWSLPPRLSAGEVEAIYDIARRSTTWR